MFFNEIAFVIDRIEKLVKYIADIYSSFIWVIDNILYTSNYNKLCLIRDKNKQFDSCQIEINIYFHTLNSNKMGALDLYLNTIILNIKTMR